MIAVVCGLELAAAAVLSPRRGAALSSRGGLATDDSLRGLPDPAPAE
jgi:hypothetical protein